MTTYEGRMDGRMDGDANAGVVWRVARVVHVWCDVVSLFGGEEEVNAEQRCGHRPKEPDFGEDQATEWRVRVRTTGERARGIPAATRVRAWLSDRILVSLFLC